MSSPCNEKEWPKYWLAIGMIQPEWIYSDPFLHHETEKTEEGRKQAGSPSAVPSSFVRIQIRSRSE